MSIKTKILAVMSIVITLSFFAGCTSGSELKVSKALLKSMDVKSAESETEITANVEQEVNVDEVEDAYMVSSLKSDQEAFNNVSEIVNNSSIKLTAKNDFAKNKASIKTVAESNGISITSQAYSQNNKAWVKAPTKSKYIEIDPAQLGSNVNTNTTFKDLAYNFVKDYLRESNYSFEDIKTKEKEVISTPDGQKEVEKVEISLNKDQATEFIEYIIQNYGESEKTEEFLKSFVDLMIKSANTSNFPDFDANEAKQEILAAIRESKQYAEENAGDMAEELLQGVSFGPNGIKIEIGIDGEGNIVSTNTAVNVVLVDGYYDGKVKYNVTLNVKTKIYNINKTTVEIPEFTKANTIGFREFVKKNDVLKDSPIGELLGVAPIYAYIEMEGETTYMNQKGEKKSFIPYEYDGIMYVPGDYIGKVLRAKVDWSQKDKTITFVSEDKTIKLKKGSKFARVNGKTVKMPASLQVYAGYVMVPVQFVAEQLGAEYSYDSGYQYEDISSPAQIRLYKD